MGLSFCNLPLKKITSRVLKDDPWFLNGQVLITRPWGINIELRCNLLSSCLVWVKLVLLVHLTKSQEALSRMASVLGKLFFIDEATADWSGAQFARFYVEIDAKNGYPENIPARIVTSTGTLIEQVPVVYEWKPIPCSTCCMFGHLLAVCPRKPHEVQKDTNPGSNVQLKEDE